MITFLDCGVLVPPGFIKKTAENFLRARNSVILHYTLGIYLQPTEEDCSIIDSLSPGKLLEISRRLMRQPSWADPREDTFDLVNDDLNRLPAPWSIGWSCALTAPRHLVQNIGGFDETFIGWGAEDIDFSLRLHQAGASFLLMRDCPALHLPHPTADRNEKEQANQANMVKIHRKNYRLDTEMLYLYGGAYCNQVIGRLEYTQITTILPAYPLTLLSRINSEILGAARNSLLVGIDNSITAGHLNVNHVFVFSQTTLEKFRKLFSNRSIHYIFGCDTPFQDRFFDAVLISDFLRLLGPKMQQKLLVEMSRIARRIFILYTEEFIPWVKDMDGLPWSGLQELMNTCNGIGLEVMLKDMNKPYKILIASRQRDVF